MYLSQFRCISAIIVKCWRFCLLTRLIAVLFWIRLVVDFKLLRDKLFEGFSGGVIEYRRSLFFLFLWRLFENGFKEILKHRGGCLVKFKNIYILKKYQRLIPVAVRSKGRVCGRLLAANTGSNPAGSISVCCEYCVLSGRGLCEGLIPRPEESYRLCVCGHVWEWEREIEYDQVEK